MPNVSIDAVSQLAKASKQADRILLIMKCNILNYENDVDDIDEPEQ